MSVLFLRVGEGAFPTHAPLTLLTADNNSSTVRALEGFGGVFTFASNDAEPRGAERGP